MVGIIAKAKELISNNVMMELVQLTGDGPFMVDGVNVQNRVAVGCNQDVAHVLNLVPLMVVRNVRVMTLKRNPVILKHVQ
jgi:hypothetical protein